MWEKLEFIDKFKISFEENTFLKILISKPTSKTGELKNISIRLVKISWEDKISFLFKYITKDIVKNFPITQALSELDLLLWEQFKNWVLFTKNNDINLNYNKKMQAKITYAKPTSTLEIDSTHNKEKKRLISIENNIYLKELWILSEKWEIIKNRQSKFKQINKYLETLEWIIKKTSLPEKEIIKIADMWCWKWYLTFATYDFFINYLKKEADIVWVELRDNLVELCNNISEKCSFQNLSFVKWNIKDFNSKDLDILIALHACDTATDDAIYKWITSNAEIIITAPCCHKQLRKELNPDNSLKDILKHWILKERQAELITDTLRWLALEAYWYKTQIFEFITDGHTHKNIMIVWIKKTTLNKKNKIEFLEKISNLKEIFWVQNFYLEDLLKNI